MVVGWFGKVVIGVVIVVVGWWMMILNVMRINFSSHSRRAPILYISALPLNCCICSPAPSLFLSRLHLSMTTLTDRHFNDSSSQNQQPSPAASTSAPDIQCPWSNPSTRDNLRSAELNHILSRSVTMWQGGSDASGNIPTAKDPRFI